MAGTTTGPEPSTYSTLLILVPMKRNDGSYAYGRYYK